jgi:hypothetical protein
MCKRLITLSVVIVVVLIACLIDPIRASRGSLLAPTSTSSSKDSIKNNLRRLPSLLHKIMFSAVSGSSSVLPPVPPVSGTGNKQILISGGAGYIGTHTIVCLIEAGYDGEQTTERQHCGVVLSQPSDLGDIHKHPY